MDKIKLLKSVSLVMVVFGILGFFLGPNLFGLFSVNTPHNLIHLGTGVLGLGAAQKKVWALWFARLMMVFYGIIAILGLLNGKPGMLLGVVPINMADNILHLLLAIVFGYIAFAPTTKD